MVTGKEFTVRAMQRNFAALQAKKKELAEVVLESTNGVAAAS